MLSCWRRVHLHKSDSFKRIFKQIQTSHTTYAKNVSKMIGKTINKSSNKWCRKTLNNNDPKYTKLSYCGSHFGICFLRVSDSCAFCLWPVFRNLWGGTPLDRFWHQLEPPWSNLVDFMEEFRSKLAPNFRDSRITNCTNHTLTTKTTRVNKQLYR